MRKLIRNFRSYWLADASFVTLLVMLVVAVFILPAVMEISEAEVNRHLATTLTARIANPLGDWAAFDRGTAEWDEVRGRIARRTDLPEADLDRLNAQALHVMDYASAQPRLQALDADLGETFWSVVRGNLNKFADVVEMAKVVRGPIQPVIEDGAFIETAAGLLPEVIDETAWSAWTNAVKAETGAKGKALFMPLRLALTGQAHGPDMAALAPLIGRETIQRRLKGEAA